MIDSEVFVSVRYGLFVLVSSYDNFELIVSESPPLTNRSFWWMNIVSRAATEKSPYCSVKNWEKR